MALRVVKKVEVIAADLEYESTEPAGDYFDRITLSFEFQYSVKVAMEGGPITNEMLREWRRQKDKVVSARRTGRSTATLVLTEEGIKELHQQIGGFKIPKPLG